MSKYYYVEAKFGTKWVLLETTTKQTDALHIVKERSGERYPLRVVRVERTVVFEEKK